MSIKDLKILFVEDEESVLRNIKEAISGEFKEFITAKNGQEGLDKFKKFNPDIVIADILMPKLDGLEMAEKIKKISADKPVIILSAFSEREKLFRAIDIRIDKYLVKPVDIDELIKTISVIAKEGISDSKIILPMGYSYDKRAMKLFFNEEFVKLTKKETLFIDTLVDNINTYATNEKLCKIVWNSSVSETAIRTFVQRLRDKTDKKLIVNISGLGYKLCF